MRWIAMSQQLDFDHDTIDVHFSPGVFQISEMEQHIRQEVEKLGGVSLVVIDTSAAYFEGDDENNNTQAGNYARMQRKLVKLSGGPTILALCHPVKNAADDNLLRAGAVARGCRE
jgi:RecA-family ATPase